MKNFVFFVAGIVAVSLAVSGCVSISKYTPPADTEKPVMQTKIGKAEPKVKIEVELLEKPDLSKFSAPKTPDNELTGNRGNFAGGVSVGLQKPAAEAPKKPRFKVWWPAPAEEKPQQEAVQPKQEMPKAQPGLVTKYKVKKGQTLGDIAALPEIYGTSKKWKKIYEANKDKIKDPNKIYEGQVLDIPREEGYGRLK